MNFPILTSVILFIIILSFAIKRSSKDERALEEFLEKEAQANTTAKKDLDKLNYISVPAGFLSMPSDPEDHDSSEALRMLNFLKDKKIVNLTGISNTDLKLEYGAANLPILASYDSNFTLLARALQMEAVYLERNGYNDHAREVLEFAVDKGSDISASYKLLALLYEKSGEKNKKDGLKEKAALLNSASKNAILRALED